MVQKTARLSAKTAAARCRDEKPPEVGPLDAVTLHGLRHSFAGVAEQLGATIPTIAAMLGHRLSGVTGGYILKRVDSLLNRCGERSGRPHRRANSWRGTIGTGDTVSSQR